MFPFPFPATDNLVQIGDLATLTDSSDIAAIDRQLRLSVVFSSNAELISQQAQINALQSGIDLTLIPDTIPFAALFDTEPEGDEIVATIDGVIKDIYASQMVTSPQQVIRRLTIRPTEDHQQPAIGFNEQLNYPRLEGLFMAHLRRYILGGDGTKRARRIVQLMTGDEYLPLSPLGTLTVCTSLTNQICSSLTHVLQIKFFPFINEHGVSVFVDLVMLFIYLY